MDGSNKDNYTTLEQFWDLFMRKFFENKFQDQMNMFLIAH